jgi:hypothetical protein
LINVARRDGLDLLEVHALLRGAAQLQEALAELVAGELADRAHAAVAEVVDVVDSPREARSSMMYLIEFTMSPCSASARNPARPGRTCG